jgi:hypothetical protein
VTSVADLQVPTASNTEGYSYTEATHCLAKIILNALSSHHTARKDYEDIYNHVVAIESMLQQVLPRLKAKKNCKTVHDRLEFFLLRLHSSFAISTLCRPALRRGTPNTSNDMKPKLAEKCRFHLRESLNMYLQMHYLGITPTRSWALTHHGLSSALLLGILGETKTNPEVRNLQGKLLDVLSEIAYGERCPIASDSQQVMLTGPQSRALTALQNIYEVGWPTERTSAQKESERIQQVEVEPSIHTVETIPAITQDASVDPASFNEYVIIKRFDFPGLTGFLGRSPNFLLILIT